MKVLYLTQWYPHRYDAMAGLFVRNHAEAAVRQGVDVCVLYCHPVEQTETGEAMEVVEQETNGVREVYVYHTCHALRALWRGRDEVLRRWGKPDMCQVNVLSKSALLAYAMYVRRGVPYVLVEHWSGYLPQNGDYLRHNGPLQRLVYEYVAKQAKCILPVSSMLKNAMKTCGISNAHWKPICNVVNDCFFEESPRPEAKAPYRLLHVSCFDEKAKNVRGILKAMQLLWEKRQDFRLTIIGTGADFETDRRYAEGLGLTSGGVVRFEGEKTPVEVCRAMQESHLFVLFSRYENAPVVLSECQAVGLPVVASRVGGIPEIVNAETGMLVPSEDEQTLAKTIDTMLDALPRYNAETIRRYGEQYSQESVGKYLLKLYESVLS